MMGGLITLLLTNACGESAPERDPEPDPAPAASEPADVPAAAVPSWEPTRAEPEPLAKRLAAETAHALINYPRGTTPEEASATAGIPAGDLVLELVDSAVVSRGRVVYVQFVGLAATSASTTVLVEQSRRTPEGNETTEALSLEIRLTREGEGWRIDELASVGGPAVDRPAALSEEARAVVDHPRIHLPSSARWDIYRGEVHAGLLRLLADLAQRHEVHVLTFVSGRPTLVFDTDRLSNHARGWAVDIYALDGVNVVDQREEGSPAHTFAAGLHALGVDELGSPWDFDGVGGRSFTDAAHRDHIHIAVTP